MTYSQYLLRSSESLIAIPKIELFTSLHELISTYPSPPALRESLLNHLHALLHETLPSLPAVIKLSATRRLTSEAVGEVLVDELKRANEKLSETVRRASGDALPGMACVYAEFLEEWCGKDVDDSLVSFCLTLYPRTLCSWSSGLLTGVPPSCGLRLCRLCSVLYRVMPIC